MMGMTYGTIGPLKPAPLVPFQNKWMKKSEGELTNPHLPGKRPLKGRWIHLMVMLHNHLTLQTRSTARFVSQ